MSRRYACFRLLGFVSGIVAASCALPATEVAAPAPKPVAPYLALLRDKTHPEHLKRLEQTVIPSVTLTNVSLARVVSVFYVCQEAPTDFTSSVTLTRSDENWEARLVTVQQASISLAALYDAICRQTDSVWWADGEVYFAPKSSLAAIPAESVAP